MPPIDMEIVHELNVIGRKDYDKDLVFESYQKDIVQSNRSEIDQDKALVYRKRSKSKKKRSKYGGSKSDRANDGDSEKIEFTKTSKEQLVDKKILESTSNK